MCLWGPFPFKPPHPDFVTNSNLPLLQEPIVDTCVKHELIQLTSELGGILATFHSWAHHFDSAAETVQPYCTQPNPGLCVECREACFP